MDNYQDYIMRFCEFPGKKFRNFRFGKHNAGANGEKCPLFMAIPQIKKLSEKNICQFANFPLQFFTGSVTIKLRKIWRNISVSEGYI